MDDEATLRLPVRHLFGGVGFLVACADGSGTALEAALRARPDPVSMDMAMPECCGYAAAHLFRERIALRQAGHACRAQRSLWIAQHPLLAPLGQVRDAVP